MLRGPLLVKHVPLPAKPAAMGQQGYLGLHQRGHIADLSDGPITVPLASTRGAGGKQLSTSPVAHALATPHTTRSISKLSPPLSRPLPFSYSLCASIPSPSLLSPTSIDSVPCLVVTMVQLKSVLGLLALPFLGALAQADAPVRSPPFAIDVAAVGWRLFPLPLSPRD